jgi:hypothetical protein
MTGTARDLLATVSDEYERIFAALEPLAAAFADTVTGAAGKASTSDLAALRGTIFAVLAEHHGLVAGAGVITAPALLADADYWLEWWWTRPSGGHEALRVNLDPTAPDFFEYTTADWYATPERTATRHVSGPYVDYACTTEYATTVAVPVHADGVFLGVAAADVLVSHLEQRVLPALRRLGHSLVLVNAAGRVLVSASPRYAPGELVPPSETNADPVALASAVNWKLLDTATAASTRS